MYSSLQFIEWKKPQKTVVVILDRISDPRIAGTILGSSYGLGASAVIGIQSCDQWTPKESCSSSDLSLKSLGLMRQLC
jgi:tRNA G18 (ribose-2'-O)-methylase SpoU